MAEKKEMKSTEDFIAYRRHLKKVAHWKGALAFLIVILIYGLYLFFAIATNGYLNQPAFSWTASWRFKLPYFSTKPVLTDFSNMQVIARWALGIIVIILALVCYGVFTRISLKHQNKKSFKAQNEALNNILNEKYGLKVSIPDINKASYDEAMKFADIQNARQDFTVIVESNCISFDAIQVDYDSDGKHRDGILAVTEIVEPKIDGLIQLRTFGKLDESIDYKGQKINRLHSLNDRLIGKYAIYSNLNENDVKVFLKDEIVDRLLQLIAFIPSKAICVTIDSGELSILVDGMKLDYLLPMDKKLDVDMLERQSFAIKLLNDVFVSFTLDSTSADLSEFDSQLGTELQF